MKSLLKIILCLLAALLLLVSAALTVVTINPESLRSTLEWALAPTGGRASIDSVDFSPGNQTLSLRGLRITGPSVESLDVSAKSLVIRADVVRGLTDGLPLREIETDGLRIAFSPEAGQNGGGFDPAILNHLFALSNLRVDAPAIGISLAQARLQVSGLKLSLSDGGSPRFDAQANVKVIGADRKEWFNGNLTGSGAGKSKGSLAGGLELKQAELRTPWLRGSVQAGLRFNLQGINLALEKISLDLPDCSVAIPVGGETLRWQGLKAALLASGQYHLVKGNAHFTLEKLSIGQILEASGQYGPQGINTRGSLNCGQTLLSGLRPLLPDAAQGLSCRGSLGFDLNKQAGGQIKFDLAPKGLAFALSDGSLDMELGGLLALAGSEDNLQWSGALLAEASGKAGGFSLNEIHLKLPLAGPLGRPGSPRPELLARAGAFVWRGRVLPLGQISAGGNLVWQGGLPFFENLTIKSGTLGQLDGAVGLSAQGPEGALAAKNIPADALMALARVFSRGKLDNWQADGGVDLALGVSTKGGGPLLTAKLTPQKLGLQSADGLLMVAGLEGALQASASIAAKPRIAAEVTLKAGQLLYDTLYLDLAQRPLDVRIGGLRQAASVWRDGLLDVRLGGMGALRLTGSLDSSQKSVSYTGNLSVNNFEMGQAFAELARPSLSASQPELALMEVGGQADLDLDFRGRGANAEISGRLAVSGAWLSPDGQSRTIDGLDLGLPFKYEVGGKGGKAENPKQWGRLRLAKLSAGELRLEKLNLTLALIPNRLLVRESLSLPLYGAKLRLSRIKVDQPLSSGYAARLNASLDRLDFSALLTGAIKLQGRLSGDLSPVVLTAKGLTCGGSLNGKFFGGKLRVSNIVARELFSGVPVFGADAVAQDVDLKSLTSALGSGVVSGRVNINLKNLRVAAGQPQAFDLRVLSRETPGVNQEVSLQAVNSISVIGTGEGLTSIGMGLVQPLFERFSYEAIGFSCTLKNDVFTVRGLIREGDVEYIVRKPPFFGINVINANKNNQISFSDMLERVRRVADERAGSPEAQ